MKTREIGAYTIYEGKNGRWVGASGPKQTDTFERMLYGEATTEQYVAEIQQQVQDSKRVQELLGTRVRWSWLN